MSSYPRMVELPPIGLDGHCTACGALPSRETGRCRCVTIHAASSATVDAARAALVEALAGNRDAPVIDRLNDFEAAVDSAAREEAYRQGYDSAMTDTEAKLRALRDEVAGLHVYGIPSGSPLQMAADEGWDRAVKAILGLISERQDAAIAATPAELHVKPWPKVYVASIANLDLATLEYVRESIEGIEHVGGTVNARGLIDAIIATRDEVRGEAPENPDFAAIPAEGGEGRT